MDLSPFPEENRTFRLSKQKLNLTDEVQLSAEKRHGFLDAGHEPDGSRTKLVCYCIF